MLEKNFPLQKVINSSELLSPARDASAMQIQDT